MRKTTTIKFGSSVITLALLCFSFTNTKAQIEITPFGGYIFKSSFEITGGKAALLESPAYGLYLTFPLKYYDGMVEFSYQRQNTKISVNATEASGAAYQDTIEVGVNYFLLGCYYEAYSSKSKVIPFGGMQVGLGTITEQVNDQTIVPFSFGFKGGLKFWPTKRIGFRLESDLNLMILFETSDFGCVVNTTGSTGCGFVISTTSSLGQLGFTGGIIFKLNKSKPEEKKEISL